jgi:hypothetical protein
LIGGKQQEEPYKLVTVFNTKGKKLKHGMTRSLADYKIRCFEAKWIDKEQTKLQLLIEGRKPTIEEYAELGEKHFGRKWK